MVVQNICRQLLTSPITKLVVILQSHDASYLSSKNPHASYSLIIRALSYIYTANHSLPNFLGTSFSILNRNIHSQVIGWPPKYNSPLQPDPLPDSSGLYILLARPPSRPNPPHQVTEPVFFEDIS